MSADAEISSIPTERPRWLGNLQLITACGIASFWVYFFAVENHRPGNDPTWLAFERSFPVPDLLWVTPLLVMGGWAMRRGRGWATPCAIAAGGALVFLGLLDASFNFQQDRYTISLGDGLLNGFINLYCFVFGVVLIVCTWRSRPDAIAPMGADATDAHPSSPPNAAQTAVPERLAGHFADKHVAVTGGSSGIGLALARKLAALGAHVTILARRPDALDDAAAAIDAGKHESALPCLALTCDVAEADQVTKAFQAMSQADRTPNVIVNSAGISIPGYFEQQSMDVFERMMQVNYFGTLHMIRGALPSMMARRDGQIVNVSSVAGFLGVFGFAGYAATKFAVWGLSEALRGELRPHGIAVSVVCPPDTDTPQLHRENEFKPAETKAISGSVKLMSADQVADAILKGMARRRFAIVPGLGSKMVRAVVGLARWLVHGYMDVKVAGVSRTQRASS